MKIVAAMLGNGVVLTVAFFALFPVLAPMVLAVLRFVLEGITSTL